MARVGYSLAAFLLVSAGTGCARQVDVEQIPIGTEVEITREDGGVVRGTLMARNDRDLRMAVGPAARSIARDEVANVEVVTDGATPPLPPVAKFREFTVPAGTALAASLDSSLASSTSRVDDAVGATLTEAVVVDGVELLSAGSRLAGVVTTATPSGKVHGVASLAVSFQSLTLADASETYALSARLRRTASTTRRDDAKTIGIPAAGGAVVGAILGGKKGAGIGAAVGGGAGTAVVLATAGDEVHLPRGTAFSMTLDRPIDVRVPVRPPSQP